ncbi:MAG: hypothetical protein OEV20_09900, partial [Actinomycetota bacterium]|nr:hypothetical protein [Actinomycetota bacterium]
MRRLAVLLTILLLSSFTAAASRAAEPHEVKRDAITLMNAFETTFFLDGKNRLAHDPYAFHSAGIDKLQTESTAMALYFGGIDNLGLTPVELQEIYDFFAYMMDDGDDWMFNDYTTGAGRAYKKSLHVAWVLVALEMLIDRGISDVDDLLARSVDALEAGTDVNGYMSGDPASNESIRTKYVQSLPFFFKSALDLGDTGAVAAARRSIDFYMANCIDANFDLWKVDASGTKTVKLVSHEMGEFAHGLYLFHQYETDAARRAVILGNLIGVLQRYTSSAWTLTNSHGEKYISNTGAAGTVNTLAQFQIQFVLALAAREGWVSSTLAPEYFPIIDRIKITGTGDPERDNNYYYYTHPDTGAVLSSNINSYLPGYVIYAMDVQYVEIAGTVLDGAA